MGALYPARARNIQTALEGGRGEARNPRFCPVNRADDSLSLSLSLSLAVERKMIKPLINSKRASPVAGRTRFLPRARTRAFAAAAADGKYWSLA